MRKIFINSNKLLSIICLLSIVSSITALCVSIKINNQVASYIHSDKYRVARNPNNDPYIINDIPDTTIIRKDGTKVEVRSYKADDKLNGIIVKDDGLANKDASNATGSSAKIEEKNNQAYAKSGAKDVGSSTVQFLTSDSNISNKQLDKISGNYVIQVGAFKLENQAKQQCEKIKNRVDLQSRQCRYVFKNNQYRVIVFPFDDKKSADEFADVLLSNKFPVLTKKNA